MDKLNNVLNEKGYILVVKLHTRDDYTKWMQSRLKQMLRTDIIRYIDPVDAHEMLKYSDRAMSFGTTMVYQTYLFDLPVLEIGSGKYYLGWADTTTKMSDSLLADYDYGADLVYGMVASNFGNKPTDILQKFLDTEYKIDDFKYKMNHPIYGDSYKATPTMIVKSILKHLGKWK